MNDGLPISANSTDPIAKQSRIPPFLLAMVGDYPY